MNRKYNYVKFVFIFVIFFMFVNCIYAKDKKFNKRQDKCDELQNKITIAICNVNCNFSQVDNGQCACDNNLLNMFMKSICTNSCSSNFQGNIATTCNEISSEFIELKCNWVQCNN